MRFIVFSSISILLFVSCSPSKKISKGNYTMDEVYIGQSFEKVIRVMGTDFTKYSHDEMWERYNSSGYDPNYELVFYNGFDYVLEYGETSNPTEYPIYLVYCKNDVAVYIVLSSYIYERAVGQYK